MEIKVAASILSADFSRLKDEMIKITAAGADRIHLDIMDGNFVPNITFGAQMVKALRPYTTLPFDVHLMIQNPQNYIEQFAEAGADTITVHAEAVTHLNRIIDQIHSTGKKAGISLVPSSSEARLQYLYDKIDLILVMTVNPGFGGQKFIPSQLGKISTIRMETERSGREISLQVDGGINPETAALCRKHGADTLVAGTAIFHNLDYAKNIALLRKN